MSKFKYLTQEEHSETVDVLDAAAHMYLMKEKVNDDGLCTYEVPLQNEVTIVTMDDDEIEASAKLTVDIMEELKKINETLSKQDLEKIEKKVREDQSSMTSIEIVLLWKEFATDELNGLVNQAAQLRRVGGAFALFIAIPLLHNAIYSAFDKIIDNFDDDLYFHSCYFVFRAILSMNPS